MINNTTNPGLRQVFLSPTPSLRGTNWPNQLSHVSLSEFGVHDPTTSAMRNCRTGNAVAHSGGAKEAAGCCGRGRQE